jgi:hypothetical protein
MCGCGKHSSVKEVSSVRQINGNRAMDLVKQLLQGHCNRTNLEICKLLQFECGFNNGRVSMYNLVLLVVARIFENEALNLVRQGNVETMTVKINVTTSAKVLVDMANRYRDEVRNASIVRFATSKTGRACGMPQVDSCFLKEDRTVTVMLCDFNCCESCGEFI